MSESQNFIAQLLPDTIGVEQKYLYYLTKNLPESFLIPSEYFLNDSSKIFLDALKNLQEKNLQVTKDELLYFCTKIDPAFNKTFIDNVFSSDLTNIAHTKEVLKENSVKHKSIKKLESFIVDLTDKGVVSFDKLATGIDDIYYSIHDLDKVELKSSEDLSNNQLQTMLLRKQGIKQRSMGYKVLDNLLTRPGAPEEMTGIVGMKGGAKSALAKNIENKLLAQKIPVVSINLEMPEESCSDRMTCMRMNIPLDELLRKDNNPRFEEKVRREIESYKSIDHYLFYSQPTITLDELDGLLYKAKNIFKQKNVLDETEYMYVVIDLLDMVEEFGTAQSSYNIKTAINRLHQINRRHKCHFLLLLQANENKLRNGKVFKKPEDLDYYKIGLEDIEGSAAIAQRCRVIMTLTRPVQMKKRFFPEENERWELETDVININIAKQNDGKEGYTKLVMTNTFRIYPFIENKEV